ncbi:MAG TPA: tetraacyldisaccharide 4'-kinase [Sedimentisphaerales bacterium]|nr:tetraacyldisaccharide 4'-kinase [Sedimentisphaerales bacterium]
MTVISGQRRDMAAGTVRVFLHAASLGYHLVAHVRNTLYDHHLLRSHRAEALVICIGNLTTGGTGKTPLVVWLCRAMNQKSKIKSQECQVAILTRGYKTRSGEVSDEPALLAAQCPDVPVVVNPDRVTGAAEAIRTHGAQILVMDDGFQHRRLARDLDIIAIDATNPFGYGRLLPAGLLREPVSGLKRAHAVILTRCNQVSEESLAGIEAEIRRVNPGLVVARSIHAPVAVRTAAGEEIPLAHMEGKRVFAFCGIGNPQAFFRTIEQMRATLAGSAVFDDHHRYTAEDLLAVHTRARQQQASLILTTQKDWTKATQCTLPEGGPPLAYLAIEARIIAGEEMLTALIDRVLSGRIPGQ